MEGRRARWVLGGILVACAFTLAVVRMEDTDAWTHLALGRDLAHFRGFPPSERLNFPSLGMPYYNPEWLFGLVLYSAYAVAGLAAVILLKATLAALAVLVLFRDALTPPDPPSHRTLGAAVTVGVLFPLLAIVRYRFVERPDLALMVFLGFTIYALNAYVDDGRRLVYLLPALAVLWVNVHPSVVLAAVPFVALLVGGGLQRLLHARWGIDLPGTPSPTQLRTIAVVFVAVLLASLVNPYGVDPYLAPLRLAASSWFRDEIVELQVPRLAEDTAPFVVAALLVLAFLLTLRRLSLVSVLLVAPFAYLALSGRRFVFLLGIVGGPVLARHARRAVARLHAERARRLAIPAAVVSASIAITLTAFFVGRVGPFDDPFKVPGVGVNYATVPEGALRYLDRVGVRGRIFNTFHWGGYIAWRDYPRRVPIVDGRGYVPPGMLDELQAAQTSPARLARLQGTYGFDVAIVNYPLDRSALKEEMPNVDFGLSSPNWALVHWDDLALVYLRRTSALAPTIERDEYRHVKPANGALYLRPRLGDSTQRGAIEAELRRNIEETGSSMGLALLGFVYNEVGAHARAIEALARVRDFPLGGNLYNAYQGLAFAYARLGNLPRAIEYYRKATQLRDDPLIFYNLGILSSRLGRDREAIGHFERAIEKDRRLAQVYPALISAYRRVGMRERALALEAAYPRALAQSQAEEHFRRGVKLYVEGKLHEAATEFRASIKVDPRNPNPRSNLGYVYFDLGRLDDAFAEQQGALEVDPEFANAHYGLALIYRARGERPGARAHFEEYLRLDPSGYWARKAREELGRIR